MNKRKTLVSITVSLLLLGLLISFIPIVSSMTPTNVVISWHIKKVDVTKIKPGTYSEIEWKNMPIVVYRPSSKDLKELSKINEAVWGPRITENETNQIYVYAPISTHLGCRLKDTEKATYNTGFPPGWYDPCHMGVWDYTGRLYKDIYLPKGKKLNNLRPITYDYISNNIIQLKLKQYK